MKYNEQDLAKYTKELDPAQIRRDQAFIAIRELVPELWGYYRTLNSITNQWEINEPFGRVIDAAKAEAFDQESFEKRVKQIHDRRDAETKDADILIYDLQAKQNRLNEQIREDQGLAGKTRDEIINTILKSPEDAKKLNDAALLLDFRLVALQRERDQVSQDIEAAIARKEEAERQFMCEEKELAREALARVLWEIKIKAVEAEVRIDVFDRLRSRWAELERKTK